jgi:hypothetical protein
MLGRVACGRVFLLETGLSKKNVPISGKIHVFRAKRK